MLKNEIDKLTLKICYLKNENQDWSSSLQKAVKKL